MSRSRLWCLFVGVAAFCKPIELASIGSRTGDGQEDSTSVGIISVPDGDGAHPTDSITVNQGSDHSSGASDVQVVESVNHYLSPGSQNVAEHTLDPVQVTTYLSPGSQNVADQTLGPVQVANYPENSISSNEQATYSAAVQPLQISDINQIQYIPQTRHNFAAQNSPPIFNVQPDTYPPYPSPVRQSYVEYSRPPSPAWGIQGHAAYPEIILDYNPEIRFSPAVSSYSSFSPFPALTGPYTVIEWFKNLIGINNC